MKLHEQIDEARKENNLSFEQLGKKVNIDRSNVSKILRGKIVPVVTTAVTLASALGYEIVLKKKEDE